MAYISLIIGCRGFGGKNDLWEIICPESYGGVTFDLGPLLQGRMWSLIPIMAYIYTQYTLWSHSSAVYSGIHPGNNFL